MKLEWGLVKLIKLKKSTRAWEKNFEWSVFKIIFYLPVSDSAKNDPSTQNRPDLKVSRASRCMSLHRNPRTHGSKMARNGKFSNTCGLKTAQRCSYMYLVFRFQNCEFWFFCSVHFHSLLLNSDLAPFGWIVLYYRYYELQFTANKPSVHEWGWTLLFIYL